jgi:hypothetical protein
MNLLSSGFFNIIFLVLILYDADPPEPARARAPSRGHAGSSPARQHESRQAMASATMLAKLS